MNPPILIVDDSLTVRMDLREVFEAAGFRTELCATAAAAREVLRQSPFALIILDVLLPDADGIQLLQEIKSAAATARIPVMLLSTEAEVRDRVRGLQTGADDYVGKPDQSSYVVARARELIREGEPEPLAAADTAVLVIDDSATFREELKSALEVAGYAVATAATGEEGLRLALNIRPRGVIVDGVLPGIDGATVIRRLRLDAVLRRTPCLLLTASEERSEELQALEAGADAFVRKAEPIRVILARLAAILRHESSQTNGPAIRASVLGPKKILAVDDSLTYLELLGEQLRQDGYDVALAHSGEEALELLAVQPVDCILLDLIMPGLSGHETCQRIKGSPALRDIPLVMLTALAEQEAMIEGINAGADDYITKSSDFEVLKARLRAQLRRRQFEEELRCKNEELERQNRQVQEANRLKSEFLANMSHELRTPLNAIIGFSELIHDGKAGPVAEMQKEFLGDILTSSRHLLQLINDVLDLSKVESGKLEFRPEVVDLAKLTGEVRDILHPLAARKQMRIVVDIDRKLGRVTTDPSRLKQVLYNYLSNAIKFSPDEGQTTVRMRPEGDAAFRLEVEDNGIGIRPEDMARLFVEFQQLDGGTAKKYQGTGLGLSLTRHIVEAQGGTVGVESVPGQGSTFFAVLPRNLEVLTDDGEFAFPRHSLADAPSILVIEDDAEDCRRLSQILKDAGFAVDTAATGAEALVQCQKRVFDAITLDLVLPDRLGWELLQEIRSRMHNQNVPVVVVTVVERNGTPAGLAIHDYFNKPVAPEQLLASLEQAGVRPHAGRYILVVDDDPTVHRLLEAILPELGYEMVCVFDGESALAMAEERRPAAMVLDLMMPGIDGCATLEKFRRTAVGQHTPVIIWTNADLSQAQAKKIASQAQGTLPKAAGGPALIDELRNCLAASGAKCG